MKKILGVLFIIFLIFTCVGVVSAGDNIDITDINSTTLEGNVSDLSLEDSLIENTSHNHTQISNLTGPVLNAVKTAPGGTFAQLQTIMTNAAAGDIII